MTQAPISKTLLPHQIPPEGDWRAWFILGGRGAGRSTAAIAWAIEQARAGHAVWFQAPGRRRLQMAFDQTMRQLQTEGLTFRPIGGNTGIDIIGPDMTGSIRFGGPHRGYSYDDLVVDNFDHFDNSVYDDAFVTKDNPSGQRPPRLVDGPEGPAELGARDVQMISWLTNLTRSSRPRVLITSVPLEYEPGVARTVSLFPGAAFSGWDEPVTRYSAQAASGWVD